MNRPFVLLADDNEATRTLIAALLRHEFVVEMATDGREAIEKLKGRRYAAILLDLLMPVVDGYAVLDYLTAERTDLLSQVLVVTASLSPNELQRLQRYEIGGVIRKPFEVDSFLDAVRRCAVREDAESGNVHPLISGSMILLLAEMIARRV